MRERERERGGDKIERERDRDKERDRLNFTRLDLAWCGGTQSTVINLLQLVYCNQSTVISLL